MSKVGIVEAQPDSVQAVGTIQTDTGIAGTGTASADVSSAQAGTETEQADSDTETNTMPGQEVLPSTSHNKINWEMPITIHKQGIKEWYNYAVTMKVSVALVIVLIMMALGAMLWSGIRKIYKKSKKHYDRFND